MIDLWEVICKSGAKKQKRLTTLSGINEAENGRTPTP